MPYLSDAMHLCYAKATVCITITSARLRRQLNAQLLHGRAHKHSLSASSVITTKKWPRRMSDSFGRRTSFQTKAVADAANPKIPKLLGARANVACCVSLGRSFSQVHVSADHFYSLFFGFSGVEICMSHFKTHIQALTWLCLILFSAVRGRERFTSGRGRESSRTKGFFFFKQHIVLPEVI
jgi:hypothetical protein